ncbi:MAG: aminotransferase class V-fold PLP-dependent enzyme [Leptospiraceae bacterium]|nr:aminotransferase class V-fold PLP-dependent enzyme [Leptospiraceae bacterium]
MIYLDYNATHPPIQEIFEKNWKRYLENPANPSGISLASQKNQSFLDRRRKEIAALLALPADCIRFSSTGTEATYWMIRTFAEGQERAGSSVHNADRDLSATSPSPSPSALPSSGPSCILSACEHDAMIAACQDAGLNIRYLPLHEGRVMPQDLEEMLQSLSESERRVLRFVSVIHASNETGVIQPVAELSRICRKYNLPFLSDCIQSAGKIPLPVSEFDAFLLNGHKLGAGAGCAVTVFAPQHLRRIVPLYRGGLQEEETRAGTENLLAIGNFADAFALQLSMMAEKESRLRPQHARLESFLKEKGVIIAGEASPRLSNTTYAVFQNLENMDFFLMGLDQAGVICSTGSSCKSRTRQPSRVLRAMGYSEKDSMQALRFSSGLETTAEEFDSLMEVMNHLLSRFAPAGRL